MFRKHVLLLSALACVLALTACKSAPKKPKPEVFFLPSMERALELLSETDEGKKLADFINENPIPVVYARLNGPWPKYDPAANQIYIPEAVKENDVIVALNMARAIDTYRSCKKLELSEITAEIEQMAALREMELAVELGLNDNEGTDTLSGRMILEELCSFMVEGRDRMLEKAKRNAMSYNPEYGRPYKSIEQSEKWLRQVKAAVEKGNLHQLLQKRDRDRVRRGEITVAEADQNALAVTSADSRVLYRQYNESYLREMETLRQIQRLYDKRMSDDDTWRKRNAKAISAQLARTSYCSSFVQTEHDRPFDFEFEETATAENVW